MKKFLVLLMIILTGLVMPVFANEDKVMPSETGVVEAIQNIYNDEENNQQNTQQIVDVKVLSGEYKNQTKQVVNFLTDNPAYNIFLYLRILTLKEGFFVYVRFFRIHPARDRMADDAPGALFRLSYSPDTVRRRTCGLFCPDLQQKNTVHISSRTVFSPYSLFLRGAPRTHGAL